MPPTLSVRGLAKRFGHVTALDGVDLDLFAGQVTALLGDNGAGKSTFIAMVSGVVTPSAGSIRVEGRPMRPGSPVAAREAGIDTVFQDLSLVDTRSITENLFLGIERVRWGFVLDRARMQREADAVLSRLRLSLPPGSTPVRALSGGQRQAVAVARTILRGSRVVILDEPTAALGLRETARVLALIRQLRDAGAAVLLVSHRIDDVLAVADRAVVFRLGRKVADVAMAGQSREALSALVTGEAPEPACAPEAVA